MIIIGDIHGNYDTLQALLDKIPQEEKDKGILLCGDLIDRGPDSKKVVQWAIDNNIQSVSGNHEDMMVDEYHQVVEYIKRNNNLPFVNSLWLGNGGYQCLKSYVEYDENDLDDRGLPKFKFDFDTFEKHVFWMNNLPTYIETDVTNPEGRKLVVSHSSIYQVWKHKDSKEEYLQDIFRQHALWGRPSNIQDVKEIYNVFGHTPIQNGPKIKVPFANIDTGCFYTREAGYGKLTALQYPEMVVYEQPNIEKVIYG